MKLKSIIKPGIVGVGISVFAAGAGEASAESFYNENPKNILVNVEKGDTLGKIIWKLDRKYGNDNPNDAVRNLDDYLISGDIAYANCNNKIRNKNIIEAERKLLIKGRALDDIDPDYGKSNISENKGYGREVVKKDIQIKTESKTRTPRHKERSLMSDISRVKKNSGQNELYALKGFVLNGGIEYGILEGAGEDVGGAVFLDINAGYEMPEGFGFTLGWRGSQINKEEYFRYRNSFFGFFDEAELDKEYLTLTDLYAQVMLKTKHVGIGGGVLVRNIGNIDEELSYGWRRGEAGIDRSYDRYTGWFSILKLMMPVDNNLSVNVNARIDRTKTKEGLELNGYSIGIEGQVRF